MSEVHAFSGSSVAAAHDGRMTAGLALYLLFVTSWLLHLSARVPLLGAVAFDLLLASVLAVLAALRWANRGDVKRPMPATSKALIALCVYVVVTLPFVEWPGSVLQRGSIDFVKAVVFYVFTVAFVRNPRDLRGFLAVFLGCQLLRIAEPLYLHWTTGYWGSVAYMEQGEEALDRLAGSPYDVVNPNGLAFVICTALPFVLLLGKGGWPSWLLRAPVLVLAGYALVLTGSRTGLLAGFVVYLGWLVFGRARAAILVGGIGIAAVLAQTMSTDLADRYLSIVGAGERNEATLIGRIDGVVANFEVALRRPFFGHGLGTSAEANFHFAGYGQVSHNLYAELAGEIGFAGLLLFAWLMLSTIASLRAAPSGAPPSSLPAGLVDALRVWLAVMLLFSFASYGLSSYEWYLLGGLGVVVGRSIPSRVGAMRHSYSASHRRPVLYVDFDHGLCDAGANPSSPAGTLQGLPASGSIAFLHRAVRDFDVVVHSPRCASAPGRSAVSEWLRMHGAPVEDLKLAPDRPSVAAKATATVEYPARWPGNDELFELAAEMHGAR